MSKCKVDYDRVSTTNPNELSTRVVKYFDAQGQERKAFRLCLKRIDIDIVRQAFETPYLYITLFYRTVEEENAFEAALLAKQLPIVLAARKMFPVTPHVRFRRQDHPKGLYQKGDVILDPMGNPVVYEELSVDVLIDEEGAMLPQVRTNALIQANNNLAWQVNQGYAAYADEYLGGYTEEDEPPVITPDPQNQQPPIISNPQQGFNPQNQQQRRM